MTVEDRIKLLVGNQVFQITVLTAQLEDARAELEQAKNKLEELQLENANKQLAEQAAKAE